MGDMADDFRAMRDHQRNVRDRIEPQRMAYAKEQLEKHGFDYYEVDRSTLKVEDYIDFFPYTGWFSGKGIGSGRGIKTLIKALENAKT